MLWPLHMLQVRDVETEEVYFRVPVEESQTVRLSWIHSIERTPWVEEYTVREKQFWLREVRVKSFGAGVDVEAAEVVNRDGWVIMRGMDRSDPALIFRYSTKAEYRLEVEGHLFNLKQRVAHHRPLQVRIETYPRFWLLIQDGGEPDENTPSTNG
ncbi:DUF1850 domain-containing protein [Desmospora activa]|uniref:DUF1850 domain-containing protein n=1 Tax=Desmospora activa TaxID=500615 RepID=UPI0014742317|nr:DUF1850 domain-containing protein [Desmospora activa]